MAKNGDKKPMSKTDILNALAESSGLSKKQVGAVMDGLAALISKNLSKKGPEVFNVPGLMKIIVVHKPATKARKGINPFTGQETMFKAKPAQRHGLRPAQRAATAVFSSRNTRRRDRPGFHPVAGRQVL